MIIGRRHFDFYRQTYVMGILNATPDSFSDGGLYLDPERALDRALQMEEEGADVIDVGGESSRPGSDPVPADEEIRRILPVLKRILPRLSVPVSVDTRRARTAEAALGEGVALVNDISALGDPEMAPLLAGREVPVILMHMKGEPKTMQEGVSYDDVVAEICACLKERIAQAVRSGIARERILVDPGIGFGKKAEDNWEILRRLDALRPLECPIVFGSSRKSFVHKTLGGSLATALFAAQKGAGLLRVHDVRETKELILMAGRRMVKE